MSDNEILIEGESPVFKEPWEAEAFALVVELNKQGVFTWGEWAETLAVVIASNEERSYYENWLCALEVISDVNGFVSQVEHEERIKAWVAAEAATPHGEPVELARLASIR